tara:strand:- start:54181 stop:55599 length:1419 start_codon:yes stop_codon:yes gene_type:complete
MKKLLICAANITQLDNFFDSNFIENIKSDYNLDFLIGKVNYDDKKRLNRIKKYGNIVESSNIHTFTTKNSIRKKINLFCYFGNEILKNKNRFKEDFLIKRTLEVNAPKLIKLFTIIYRLRILKILVKFFLFFLRKNPLSILKINNIRNYELVIIAYKIYDPTSFVDELIRYCKSKKILTYGVQINWDALVFRIPLEIPNFLAVWGEQSFSFSVGLHEIAPFRIFPTGPLAFDIYRNNKITKENARKNLDLPINGKIIAVCLSDIVFDDIFLVNEINKHLNTGTFSENTYFYFKGYRYGKELTLKNSYKLEYNKEFENTKLHKNIFFWDPDNINLDKRDYFKNFFKAFDGIISTFSTMTVEASLHDIPSVALHYDPSKYGVRTYGFPFKLYSYHLYALRNQEGLIFCNSREELKNSINRILDFNNSPKMNNYLQKIPLSSVYFGQESSSDKLKESIKIILEKGSRDSSFIGYK